MRGRILLVAAALAVAASAFGQTPAGGDERFRQLLEQARARAAGAAATPPEVAEARLRERAELLRRGEASLAALDVDAALAAFEQAAAILHAADAELSLVRAYMQAGEYRRALAFVAHTAGAHRDAAGGPAMYGWLLHLGGQRAAAGRVVDEAMTRLPRDAILPQVGRLLASPAPIVAKALLEPPARLAPYGAATTIPAGARVAGTGIVVDQGRRAIVPRATLGGARFAWLRNGVGRTSRASVVRRVPGIDAVEMRVDEPFDVGSSFVAAARDAFPGSPGITLEYAPSRGAEPSWPLLTVGFLGMPLPDRALRRLGLDLSAGPRGGPVLDGEGRLVGVSVPGVGGGDRLVPVSLLRELLGDAKVGSVPAASGPAVPVEQVYETALRATVQVIVARGEPVAGRVNATRP